MGDFGHRWLGALCYLPIHKTFRNMKKKFTYYPDFSKRFGFEESLILSMVLTTNFVESIGWPIAQRTLEGKVWSKFDKFSLETMLPFWTVEKSFNLLMLLVEKGALIKDTTESDYSGTHFALSDQFENEIKGQFMTTEPKKSFWQKILS
jgi:hypothetical protein